MERNCLISSFYIKPQQEARWAVNRFNCLISSFYIKPQPPTNARIFSRIVLYRLSTSNHNLPYFPIFPQVIVLYRLSTSNHNVLTGLPVPNQLSYIVFLHQTTTQIQLRLLLKHCLISSFYIKPQPIWWLKAASSDCLISSFYIKPQLHILLFLCHIIVLYRLSTSNHNNFSVIDSAATIVLYRLSTSNHNRRNAMPVMPWLSYIVFLHQTTTSGIMVLGCAILSYIVFLHQTTTSSPAGHHTTDCLISSFYIKPQQWCRQRWCPRYCLISSFYIKPQLLNVTNIDIKNCLISSFYIKPQHSLGCFFLWFIVLYRLSTSNHNSILII